MLQASKPHQTVLVSCKGSFELMGKEKDVDNIITVDWHMPASFSPPLYVIAIGKQRFSLSLIKQAKVFCVNFMSHGHEKEVLFCGRNSGVKHDKYKETGLTPVECDSIDCKRIKQAAAAIECEVVNEVETGSHIMIIGKVLKTHNISDRKRLFHLGNDEFTTTMR